MEPIEEKDGAVAPIAAAGRSFSKLSPPFCRQKPEREEGETTLQQRENRGFTHAHCGDTEWNVDTHTCSSERLEEGGGVAGE